MIFKQKHVAILRQVEANPGINAYQVAKALDLNPNYTLMTMRCMSRHSCLSYNDIPYQNVGKVRYWYITFTGLKVMREEITNSKEYENERN